MNRKHRDGGQADRAAADANQRGDAERDRGRSLAEWVSLGISLTILLGLVGLVSWQQLAGRNRPPTIAVEPRVEAVRHERGQFYVPVDVINHGDQTAEDVKVRLDFGAEGDRRESAELTVTFLAGGDTAHATAVFRSDPSAGSLTASVVSFLEP